MEQNIIYDEEYLRYLLKFERDAFLVSYIEQSFPQESWRYQLGRMFKFPFFANKILDDYELTNQQKLITFFKEIARGKSKIITTIGGRGQGKTAFGMFIIEELHKHNWQRSIYYVKVGERPHWLPQWIFHAQSMEHVPVGSFAMIDETAIEYGARNFYQDKNKNFTERLVILRHKDISVLLITQHSKMVDINIRRLSDILIYKKGADVEYDKSDEQKGMIIRQLMPRDKTQSLIFIKAKALFLQVKTGLPEFWDDSEVSKTFRDYNPEAMKRLQRGKQLKARMEIYKEKERIRVEARGLKKGDQAPERITVNKPEEGEVFAPSQSLT